LSPSRTSRSTTVRSLPADKRQFVTDRHSTSASPAGLQSHPSLACPKPRGPNPPQIFRPRNVAQCNLCLSFDFPGRRVAFAHEASKITPFHAGSRSCLPFSWWQLACFLLLHPNVMISTLALDSPASPPERVFLPKPMDRLLVHRFAHEICNLFRHSGYFDCFNAHRFWDVFDFSGSDLSKPTHVLSVYHPSATKNRRFPDEQRAPLETTPLLRPLRTGPEVKPPPC